MANPLLVEEVMRLSRKGKSTQAIRTLLYKKHDTGEVDDAIKFYIDNFVAAKVKHITGTGSDSPKTARGPIAQFFVDLLFFRGALPPLLVFFVLSYFGAKYGLALLFGPGYPSLMLYFVITVAFIIYLTQSGIVYSLMTVFSSGEEVENRFTQAMIVNLFIVFIGAFCSGFFLFSENKIGILFVIAAPVVYTIVLSSVYSLSILRCFFLGILLAIVNDLLTAIMLFTAGALFMGTNILMP